MLWLLSILLFATSIVLFRHIRRLNRLLREMEEAVRSRRHLLTTEEASFLSGGETATLLESLNELIDANKLASRQTEGYWSQGQAMLGAIHEAVIVFNAERVIEYANPSAEKLFSNGRAIQGLRLDGVLRSLSLLELLEDATEADQIEARQISIERGSKQLWFEASCARVKRIDASEGESTLLVLHDITKLKRLEVMRREFVANVSHELRTPLTIIKGFAETLVDDGASLDPEARLRFSQKIVSNAERLHVLVEDLMTLSKLESRPDGIEAIEQPIGPIFEEVAENYRARLKDAQRIDVEVDPVIGHLPFDRYQILQVLDNLMENVFRYAPDFTRIVLEAKVDVSSEMVCCSVIDDGPGIPEPDLPHLFERFYRVDKGRSRERGGTGLGLSIVKHIVQLHEGNVSAESTLGEGTRMIFELPRVRPSTQGEAAAEAVSSGLPRAVDQTAAR